mgnify:CR=1 FL=1
MSKLVPLLAALTLNLVADAEDLPADHAARIKEGIALFQKTIRPTPFSYTHLRAHETVLDLVCRLLLEKKKNPTLPYSFSSSLFFFPYTPTRSRPYGKTPLLYSSTIH